MLYDRRGYGRSLEAPPARTMLDHADDLLAILEDFPVPPVPVIAHSFGSNVAMLAATLRPGALAGLGVWEPPLPWVEWWPEGTKRYNAMVAAADDPARVIEGSGPRVLGDEGWERLIPGRRWSFRAEGDGTGWTWDPSWRRRSTSATWRYPPWSATEPTGVTEHATGAQWLVSTCPAAQLPCRPRGRSLCPPHPPRRHGVHGGCRGLDGGGSP